MYGSTTRANQSFSEAMVCKIYLLVELQQFFSLNVITRDAMEEKCSLAVLDRVIEGF